MNEEFTAKEIEMIKKAHIFRRNVGYGKMIIEFHDHDISCITAEIKEKPAGEIDPKFVEKVFSLFMVQSTNIVKNS